MEGRKFMAAAAAAAALSGEAYAQSPKPDTEHELHTMHVKLKEAKSPSWVNALLAERGPLTDAQSLVVKEQARTLANSDELQLLLASLEQLVKAGKIKKGEAVSLFMDVTKQMDPETLEVKVSGVGTTRTELSEAVATAIAHTESDGRYNITTPAAPAESPTIAGTSTTQALAKAATKRPSRKK